MAFGNLGNPFAEPDGPDLSKNPFEKNPYEKLKEKVQDAQAERIISSFEAEPQAKDNPFADKTNPFAEPKNDGPDLSGNPFEQTQRQQGGIADSFVAEHNAKQQNNPQVNGNPFEQPKNDGPELG